jgi:hypothetical protein
MADTVEIIYAHHTRDHVPGDRETVDRATAKRLVRTGRANYATKAAATRTEGDAGADKTERARGATKNT